MIVGVLQGFIERCDRLKITPTENHITVFLEQVKCENYKEAFIKFCFYQWEYRHQTNDLEELFFETLTQKTYYE